MFKKIFILAILTALSGCTLSQEAFYIDYEFGKAQIDAFDQQIAYKDYRYADSNTVDMPGIHAEKIMDTYQESFDRNYDDKDNQKNFTRGFLK